MKYIKTLEAYKDFIGKGDSHVITDIDDDYVLKMPDKHTSSDRFYRHIITMKEYPKLFPNVKLLNKRKASIEKLNTKLCLEEIKHMRDYFCNVLLKECESYDNIINNLYFANIMNEIRYMVKYEIYNHKTDKSFHKWLTIKDNENPQNIDPVLLIQTIKNTINAFKNDTWNFTKHLYTNRRFYQIFSEINKNDEISLKWLKFFEQIKESGLKYLDIHDENFGIDKKGNIKLLDF